MKKFTLEVEDLTVESFDAGTVGLTARGTVQAHSGHNSCYCPNDTVDQNSCVRDCQSDAPINTCQDTCGILCY